MKKFYNVNLFGYSTMRTHSVASVMYTPTDNDELKASIIECGGECHFLGAGSNVVFATRVETPVVNLLELNDKIVLNEDSTITCGCSVGIQKLVNFGRNHLLGGFEYLWSLPASVGGIVYMNAGRGRKHNQSISDWVVSVDYLDLTNMQIKTMIVDKDEWAYRHSPFQEMKAVILSATFKMERLTKEIITSRIQERIKIVREHQDADKPSCGSVFLYANPYIMRIIRGKRIGGACYSRKTNNWISNDMNGTAENIIDLVEYGKKWHKRLGQKCNTEIRFFK